MSAREILIAAARRETVRADVEPYLADAAAEGMTGLLARAAEPVPRTLRAQMLSLEARAAQMVSAAARIAAAFDEARIPLLVFKGAVLAQQLYGEPGTRVFSDVDLLVAPENAVAGEELLRRLSYAETPPLTAQQRETNRRFTRQSLFQGEVLVDFHSAFSNAQFPLHISFADAWSRRQTVVVDGHPFQTLGELDLVVVTCSHAAKHLWHRLELLAQIAALVERHVDWIAVDELAVSARAARQAGLSFALAAEILGTAIPPLPRCAAAAAPVLDRVRPIVETNLFQASRRADAAGRDHFLLADHPLHAWRSLALGAFVPTHPDWQQSRHPWLTRPFRLLRNRLKR